jgi:hypothetical protein
MSRRILRGMGADSRIPGPSAHLSQRVIQTPVLAVRFSGFPKHEERRPQAALLISLSSFIIPNSTGAT